MTKVFHVLTKTEPKQLIGIRVESVNAGTFTIPIVDVCRSDDARRKAASMEKAVNMQRGSKFFKGGYSGIGKPY